MTRRRQILVTIAALLALQTAALVIYRAVQRSRSSPSPPFTAQPLDERAPPIIGTRDDGTTARLTWPAPRPRLVHFWATWCEPCRTELPSLLAFARVHRDRIDVIAIAIDDDWPAIRAFVAAPVPPEIVIPVDTTAHAQFGVTTLPDTYLVDRDGRVLERYQGARDWSRPEAAARIPR